MPTVFSKTDNSRHSNPGPIHALVCMVTLLRCCLLEIKEQTLLLDVVVCQRNKKYQTRVLIMQTYHTEFTLIRCMQIRVNFVRVVKVLRYIPIIR